MSKVRFVGLDVHKDTIVIAVADEGEAQPAVVGTVPHDVPKLIAKLRELGRGAPLRICYEAGPTGFALHRKLADAKFDCIVVAPSLVPDAKGNRVKTDGRDAIRLARFLRSGDLKAVHVPDGETEAMRDLSRAREAAMKAKQTARQQLSAMGLRHGRAFHGKQGTKAHMAWLTTQTFEHEAQRRVWKDLVNAYLAAIAREEKLVKDIEELVATWTLEPIVRALMALRGVQLITAFTLVAEVADFARFAKAPQFASFLGMTPSEQSSGDRTRRGSITRAGNSHARRLLIESAWNHRATRPSSTAIRKRREAVPASAVTIAEKAEDRLSRRFFRLGQRGKERTKIAVAIGRELACFAWAIANDKAVLEQVEERRALKKKEAKKKAA